MAGEEKKQEQDKNNRIRLQDGARAQKNDYFAIV